MLAAMLASSVLCCRPVSRWCQSISTWRLPWLGARRSTGSSRQTDLVHANADTRRRGLGRGHGAAFCARCMQAGEIAQAEASSLAIQNPGGPVVQPWLLPGDIGDVMPMLYCCELVEYQHRRRRVQQPVGCTSGGRTIPIDAGSRPRTVRTCMVTTVSRTISPSGATRRPGAHPVPGYSPGATT